MVQHPSRWYRPQRLVSQLTAAINVPPQRLLERILTLEIMRVTERAAVSAARPRQRGGADQAAADAMRRELNKLPIESTVVIGEGERDEAPMLYIGEKVGIKCRPASRYRRRSAWGHILCAKNIPHAIAIMAMAPSSEPVVTPVAANKQSPRTCPRCRRSYLRVKFRKDVVETETAVMRSVTGTVRCIKAEHRQLEKFHLD